MIKSWIMKDSDWYSNVDVASKWYQFYLISKIKTPNTYKIFRGVSSLKPLSTWGKLDSLRKLSNLYVSPLISNQKR